MLPGPYCPVAEDVRAGRGWTAISSDDLSPGETAMSKARVERRISAILALDVVGYSRLIEENEESTLGALKTLRLDVIDPLVDEHRGRMVKLMGDGAIAEFSSVVDAAGLRPRRRG
jgi:adenylate cyclase